MGVTLVDMNMIPDACVLQLSLHLWPTSHTLWQVTIK